MKILLSFLVAAAVLALVGCSTVSSRIQEKPGVFASLDPQTQARLEQSIIAVGDTTDMVYIALGKPDDIREKTTAEDHTLIWVYKDYWQEYEGTQMVGFHRRLFYNPATRTYRAFYEPVHIDVYRDRTEERTRVTFKDNKVTVVEQAKS